MLVAKDFRQRAWNNLSGKWGTMALATLIMSLITGTGAALAFIFIGGIVTLIITGPLMAGMCILTLHIVRASNVKIEMLFDGFKIFGKAFLLYILNGIFTFLWSLLFIIPGIIKTYSYSMSYYILLDNPELSSNEARLRSIEMMRGNKWRLFCLHFSFIGWGLLTLLTFGILIFWVQPYMQTAQAEFYQSLLPETEPDSATVNADPFAPDSNGGSDIGGKSSESGDPFDSADNANTADGEPNSSEQKSRTDSAVERLLQ